MTTIHFFDSLGQHHNKLLVPSIDSKVFYTLNGLLISRGDYQDFSSVEQKNTKSNNCKPERLVSETK